MNLRIDIMQIQSMKKTFTFHTDLEELEDTKGVIRICKSKKNIQHNDQKKKGQTTIYKAVHRKLKIEQHESY
jgi:hypothetical protein